MIEKGVAWGRAVAGPADCEVTGDDVALAEAVAHRPGARVMFHPTPASDFARALGVTAGAPIGHDPTTELPCDLLRVRVDEREIHAVNMVVVGSPPDRQGWGSGAHAVRVHVDGRPVLEAPATAVVIASGQYLRGVDLVPRGHPGDGRAEVHVYRLRRSERRPMRSRLARGEHLPHPRITTTSGRTVVVEAVGGPFPVEIDGVGRGRARAVTAKVVPDAFSVLV
jgi:hypothetical protein